MGDKMLEEFYEQIEDTERDIDYSSMEKINLMAYEQMPEFIDNDSSYDSLSLIEDPIQKRMLINNSIKSFDIYQIIDKKRYYMGEVTFFDESTVSFIINTYSKVVKYLDGVKMDYEYIRTVAREDMKRTYYKKKTDGSSSRSYNKPQPDRFHP